MPYKSSIDRDYINILLISQSAHGGCLFSLAMSSTPKAAHRRAGSISRGVWRTARLVRLVPRQQTNSDGDNADADEKDDDWSHRRKG
jgi:hypothetical protein